MRWNHFGKWCENVNFVWHWRMMSYVTSVYVSASVFVSYLFICLLMMSWNIRTSISEKHPIKNKDIFFSMILYLKLSFFFLGNYFMQPFYFKWSSHYRLFNNNTNALIEYIFSFALWEIIRHKGLTRSSRTRERKRDCLITFVILFHCALSSNTYL